MNEQTAEEFASKATEELLKHYVIIKKEEWEKIVTAIKEIKEATDLEIPS